METKHNVPNIELRSEEVQELMGKIPPTILRVGISVILIFVILIYIACNFIKYPDILAVPIVAKNVNCMAEIKALKSGQIIKLKLKHGSVCMGDTLAQIVAKCNGVIDTVCVKSPLTGVVYPCDIFREKDFVDANDALCIVVDSVKELITAKAHISADLKRQIEPGMATVSNINNNTLQGRVVSIAEYANPADETFAMTIVFEKSKVSKNTIVWNYHTNAKIKITECSVFDKFIRNKIKTTF